MTDTYANSSIIFSAADERLAHLSVLQQYMLAHIAVLETVWWCVFGCVFLIVGISLYRAFNDTGLSP